jgi:multiple sugar transport system permease protein
MRKRYAKSRLARKALSHSLGYLGYLFIAIFALFPLFFLFVMSLKPIRQVFAFPPVLFPNPPTFANYSSVLSTTPMPTYWINSFNVSVAATFLALFIASIAAYGFSRFQFKYKYFILVFLLGLRLIPGTVNMVPIYLLAARFGMLNRLETLIIFYASMRIPFMIWILKGFFDTIPVSIEEAAIIDGASYFRIMRSIFIPLVLPGLSAASLFSFVNCWNQFILPLTLIDRADVQVAAVGLYSFLGVESTYWHLISTATVLTILPLIVLYVGLQKMFIAGLVKGSIK